MKRKSFLKTSVSHIKDTIVVSEEGELLGENKEVISYKYLANSKEEFLLLYVSAFSLFYQLNGTEIKTFTYLLQHYPTSLFALTKTIKESMSQTIGVAVGSINNALTVLSEKKLLYRVNTNTYQINPRYAWKGSTKDREFNLKILLENCPDC